MARSRRPGQVAATRAIISSHWLTKAAADGIAQGGPHDKAAAALLSTKPKAECASSESSPAIWSCFYTATFCILHCSTL